MEAAYVSSQTSIEKTLTMKITFLNKTVLPPEEYVNVGVFPTKTYRSRAAVAGDNLN